MPMTDSALVKAQFDRRLMSYYMLQAQFVLLASVVGIPLMPIWLLLGHGLHRRQWQNLGCELTGRTLNVRRGVIVKVQQSIPLDKITDLALYEGPLLRAFGLCSLRIETAGGGQASATGQAMLPAVVDAEAFRDAVLTQRDRVVLEGAGSGLAVDDGTRGARAVSGDPVLAEIRDTLVRVEALLQRGR